MRSFISILVFFIFGIQLCKAQDSTIVLKASMLDKAYDEINLSELNGWIFKHENDTGFSKLNIDTTGWKHVKPSELSSKYADKNGRLECWFRIKIKFDSSFLNQQIGFDFPIWAATELYMDGKMLAARGNTGNNGKPFREYNGDIDPVWLRFETSAPHIFAIHFAGYISPIPPYELKANGHSFRLLGPNFTTTSIKITKTIDTFFNLWLIVCALLSILFWLLLFQNWQEKNLFWVALCTTVLTLMIYCLNKENSIEISYISYTTYDTIATFLLFGFSFILIPLFLTRIFKRKMNKKLLIVLVILTTLTFSAPFTSKYNSFIGQIIIAFLVILGICFYYVISSWKSLKGAQWAIVVGLLFSIFFLIFGFIIPIVFKSLNNSTYFSLSNLSCFILSLPLSLMVYVSLRFKEIIKEEQQNAAQVVRLSEEKQEHALNQQKVLQEEVNRQTTEIRNTLDNLKSTQSQLIQSEKMASLGELTAGIAHEIQNPLNFVNNFSEVNAELIGELQGEAEKGNIDEVKIIANDIKENSEKINHHGKRAGDIVKGMLQHSRSSTGVKEPTDINPLADEYLRLSFHGLRAKDKSFNATMKTDFDETIGKINIIPQDIGRVLLNLYNNAFYAVDEKKKACQAEPVEAGETYEPTVSVTTKKSDNHVIITVSDNGNGIPQKIVDKIFQPFFTTKPTGSGTGLGLSLSYDIVKAHGGEIKVESKENKARPDDPVGRETTFTIQLPI